MDPLISRKYTQLQHFLLEKKKVAVAFSGGVDSSLVLYAAVQILGSNNVLALHAALALHGPDDFSEVQKIAGHIGCRLFVLPINPLDWPEFVENPVNRCYICKKKIFGTFRDHLGNGDIVHLVDGTNADDLQQFRPGLKALEELGVASPLADAGLGKKEIRTLSREFSLPTWNKPSASCLATRIDPGHRITPEKLAMVAAIEQFLAARGYAGSRARLSFDRLLVELQQADNVRFFDSGDRQALLDFVEKWEIKKVYLDILGRE